MCFSLCVLSQVVSPKKNNKGFDWELYWAFTAKNAPCSPDPDQHFAYSGEVNFDLPPGARPMPRQEPPGRQLPPGVAQELLQILPFEQGQQQQQQQQQQTWEWLNRNTNLLGHNYQKTHGISNQERETAKFQMMCWRGGDGFRDSFPLQRFAVPENYKVIEAPEPLRREMGLFFCMARFKGLEVTESCLKELRSRLMGHISGHSYHAASVAGVRSRREHSRREPIAIVGDPC